MDSALPIAQRIGAGESASTQGLSPVSLFRHLDFFDRLSSYTPFSFEAKKQSFL
jgi:hypothetical protein